MLALAESDPITYLIYRQKAHVGHWSQLKVKSQASGRVGEWERIFTPSPHHPITLNG
ncbi:MAG: hypothetical protein RIE73_14300 [Coleofasciculus sp. C1-SOL-03]